MKNMFVLILTFIAALSHSGEIASQGIEPDDFWPSGGSANTNLQSGTERWEKWRNRTCTLALCYNTRDAGWGAFMPDSGQPHAYTRSDLRLLIQTSPYPTNVDADYTELAEGAYDSQWKLFGSILKAADEAVDRLPSIVSVAWEMNGDYMSWGQGSARGKWSTPSEYIAGFRRIVTNLRSAYPDIKIAWTPNGHNSVNPTPDSSYLYPGDAYVDYIGVDYYDHYPSAGDKAMFVTEGNSPDGILWFLKMARDHSKLFIVPEWGIAPGSAGNTTGDNPDFITWMFEVFQDAHATGHMGGECYFNDKKGGGNVDSDLIDGGNPLSAARYVSLYSAVRK